MNTPQWIGFRSFLRYKFFQSVKFSLCFLYSLTPFELCISVWPMGKWNQSSNATDSYWSILFFLVWISRHNLCSFLYACVFFYGRKVSHHRSKSLTSSLINKKKIFLLNICFFFCFFKCNFLSFGLSTFHVIIE